jgi:hypothetical protein
LRVVISSHHEHSSHFHFLARYPPSHFFPTGCPFLVLFQAAGSVQNLRNVVCEDGVSKFYPKMDQCHTCSKQSLMTIGIQRIAFLPASMEILVKRWQKTDPRGDFLHAFHRTPSCRAIWKYNTVPLPRRHSRTVLRLNLILPIPYCKPAQKLVANAERSCAVNVKSCSRGGTAWRRKIFRNSRVNGAPLTVFEFEPIVIACICVGVCDAAVLVINLVAGLLVGIGRFSHFSIIIVLVVRPIEKSRTIFTSPLESSS